MKNEKWLVIHQPLQFLREGRSFLLRLFRSQIWPYSHNAIPEDWGIAIIHDNIIDDDIPEFSSWIILPLFLMGTLAIIDLRKKLKKQQID